MKKGIISTILLFMATFAYTQHKTVGQIIRLEPDFDALIDKDAKIEVLADGFVWSEGPAWIRKGNYLIFSDVPANTIYKWKEDEGLSVYLKPSGYTGRGQYSREPGSNGMTVSLDSQIIACEHGDRRVSIMPTEGGGKKTLADNYEGKRFNSPNDVIQRSNGDIYFTDPPYGLPLQENDSTRETKIFGVYSIAPNGVVSLLIDDLLRPNGLAFSHDEKTLYVAQSDPKKAYIMSYPVVNSGILNDGQVFFDATLMVEQGLKGLPDGLKVDQNGNLFATGPGGILVISPKGKLLGRLDTGQPTANCTWGDDGSTLYITANNLLCRIKTKTKAAFFR